MIRGEMSLFVLRFPPDSSHENRDADLSKKKWESEHSLQVGVRILITVRVKPLAIVKCAKRPWFWEQSTVSVFESTIQFV